VWVTSVCFLLWFSRLVTPLLVRIIGLKCVQFVLDKFNVFYIWKIQRTKPHDLHRGAGDLNVTFSIPCIKIQLTTIRSNDCTHFFLKSQCYNTPTPTYFGPHWPIIKERTNFSKRIQSTVSQLTILHALAVPS